MYILAIDAAIKALTNSEFAITNEIVNQEDFNNYYKEVAGVTEDGSAIFVENPADFSVTWDQVNAKFQELLAAEPLRILRKERDRLIAETDWWVVPDRTPTQEQLDYRQALRDITDSYSSLDDVVWPEKP